MVSFFISLVGLVNLIGWIDSPDNTSGDVQCCYTPFHLKCIKSWAVKSVKDMREAYRIRGEDKPGEWRCPGCQRHRLHVPQSYMYVLYQM